MSKSQRDKGKRGEREARDLLAERDYEVIELGAGRATEDIFATSPAGRSVSVEVKHHRCPDIAAFRKQAREQRAKRRSDDWLLLVRIPDKAKTFYVEGSNVEPTVWKGR